jgi:hypothetical protein
MPDDVYKKYSIRSEHSLFVEFKDGIETYRRCDACVHNRCHCYHQYTDLVKDTTEKTSNLSAEYKTWFITITKII